MSTDVSVTIDASREAVWAAITDIEGAAARISGIETVEILERPESGLVGLRWRETRTLFGKTATEVMWITEAVPNEHYRTRAESHGCAYVCTMRIGPAASGCTLTMAHETQPQTFMAKLMTPLFGLFFKGAMVKAIRQDLDDIKAAVEGPGGEGTT